jgi:Zn-dependent alcohol dehydrogenase
VIIYLGVGWVRAVGQNVRIAAVGDAVSLSFASCRKCQPCSNSHPGYCTNFAVVNYGATIAYQMSGGQDLPGYFFGQSSFANHSNVPESSVVNISHLITDERDMHAYAAMGCSFQAGSATITKLAGARKEDSVVIMGVGAVGLSAIMVSYCKSSPVENNVYPKVFLYHVN